MRIVLKGKPKKLLKVTPEMLPDVLDDAHFGYCDLSDLDLSGFHMWGVSMYRSIAKRVIFPDTWAKMRHFYSRCHYEGGDPRPYEGSVIPEDVSSFQHDLIGEVMCQHIGPLQEEGTLAKAADFLAGNYAASWADVYSEIAGWEPDAAAIAWKESGQTGPGPVNQGLFQLFPKLRKRQFASDKRESSG